jgi:phosphoribosylaminoimidazole-succinocarboxamide synthase
MDKDRFRQDLGQVEQAYQRVLERVVAHSVKN